MTPLSLTADDRARRSPARLRLLSDERLAERVRAGDERAFDVLFERHQPGVLSFCRYLLGTRDEAQDAVQQAFLRLHGALLRDEQPAELRPFLYAIARNRCRSLLAADRGEVALDHDRPDLSGLNEQVAQREDLRALVADISRLPEEQRSALVLAEMGGLTHAGIAEVLEVPEVKVRTLIYQAKSALLAERDARERSCDDVRAELATATGAALRRAPLRRHLRSCSGCRAFKKGLARQQAALGIVLPVAAASALKGGLGATAAGGAAAGVGAAGVAAGGGGGLLSGLGAFKAAAVVAALGAGAAGGTFAVDAVQDDSPAPRERVVAVAPAAVPPTAAAPAAPVAVVTPTASVAPRARKRAVARRKAAERAGEARRQRGGPSSGVPAVAPAGEDRGRDRSERRRTEKAERKTVERAEQQRRKAAKQQRKDRLRAEKARERAARDLERARLEAAREQARAQREAERRKRDEPEPAAPTPTSTTPDAAPTPAPAP